MPEVSVIVPVYNASKFIVRFVGQLSEALLHHQINAEIILVDDHSPDQSVLQCQQALAGVPLPGTLIELQRNVGQYFATLVGLDYAKGNVLITMDCDFSPPPLVLKDLWGRMPALTGNVTYVEFPRRRTWLRMLGSWGFNSIVRMKTGKQLDHHSGSSFRLIDRSVYESARLKLKKSTQLDVRLMQEAADVGFVELRSTEAEDFSQHSMVRLLGYFVTLLSSEMRLPFVKREALETSNVIKDVYTYRT